MKDDKLETAYKTLRSTVQDEGSKWMALATVLERLTEGRNQTSCNAAVSYFDSVEVGSIAIPRDLVKTLEAFVRTIEDMGKSMGSKPTDKERRLVRWFREKRHLREKTVLQRGEL